MDRSIKTTGGGSCDTLGFSGTVATVVRKGSNDSKLP
jgi:hypothetical protein